MEPISRPQWLDKIRGGVTQHEVTKAEIEAAKKYMESDPGLAKNGWTAQELAAYHKGRGGLDFTPVIRKRKPKRTNGKHNPHRWRR